MVFAGRSGRVIPSRAEGRLLTGAILARPSFGVPLVWLSVVLGVVAVGGALWLTYEGLKVGFL